MIRQAHLLFLLLALAAPLNAQVVTDGLLLHYDFTEGSAPDAQGVIQDLSGHGLDGVIRPTVPAPAMVERTGWLDHHIRQGDGRGGWVPRPAKIQALKAPGSDQTMPFGIVSMDNGELALICSDEKRGKYTRPVIAFSPDGGDTWSDFQIIEGASGRPMNLTWHGGGRLSFVTGRRYYSDDYGRTWLRNVEHPPTKSGRRFHLEGNAWVDRDEQGNALAIHELGWHYEPGKSHPVDDATVVYRRSPDGGETWTAEVTPPQWKFSLRHKGEDHLRGVSEGAIARAANGDLVAALRSDMPPQYFDGPHDDSLEGTAISISADNGETWSEMDILYYAGRHHANLQRMPGGDLVCTMVVRADCDDTQHKLASYRRGMDAVVSRDNGRTWNLDRRYELDAYDYSRPDGYWVDGKAGHIGAVALEGGQMISVYGYYQPGVAVLVKWTPESDEVADANASPEPTWTRSSYDTDIFSAVAQPDRDYVVADDGLRLHGAAWIQLPRDDRLLGLDRGTIEFVMEPKKIDDMPLLIQSNSVHREKRVNGFFLAYDLRPGPSVQRLFSDQRVELEEMEYSMQVAGPNTPLAFEEVEQQIAYVVSDDGGRFYRDGQPFETWQETGAGASLFNYTLDRAGGDKSAIYLSVASRVNAEGTVGGRLHARLTSLRIYDRALSVEELRRNWGE